MVRDYIFLFQIGHKKIAKLGASFVPIATPLTCRKNNSPKVKIIFEYKI